MEPDNIARGVAFHSAVNTTLGNMQAAADAIARDFNEDNATVLAAIAAAVGDHFSTARGSVMDSRTARWRCRFRIYDAQHMDEPVADSDDELPPDRPGTMLIHGLPNVAVELRALAQGFHGSAALVGLSREELDRRLRGLRPTISRNKGRGVWRVPYDTLETFNERSLRRGWLMRVDILREIGDEAP